LLEKINHEKVQIEATGGTKHIEGIIERFVEKIRNTLKCFRAVQKISE